MAAALVQPFRLVQNNVLKNLLTCNSSGDAAGMLKSARRIPCCDSRRSTVLGKRTQKMLHTQKNTPLFNRVEYQKVS